MESLVSNNTRCGGSAPIKISRNGVIECQGLNDRGNRRSQQQMLEASGYINTGSIGRTIDFHTRKLKTAAGAVANILQPLAVQWNLY